MSVHLAWCCKALQRTKAGIKDSISGVGGLGKNSTAVVELKINQTDELSVPQLETLQKPLIEWLMFGDQKRLLEWWRGLWKGITHLAVNG